MHYNIAITLWSVAALSYALIIVGVFKCLEEIEKRTKSWKVIYRQTILIVFCIIISIVSSVGIMILAGGVLVLTP